MIRTQFRRFGRDKLNLNGRKSKLRINFFCLRTKLSSLKRVPISVREIKAIFHAKN